MSKVQSSNAKQIAKQLAAEKKQLQNIQTEEKALNQAVATLESALPQDKAMLEQAKASMESQLSAQATAVEAKVRSLEGASSSSKSGGGKATGGAKATGGGKKTQSATSNKLDLSKVPAQYRQWAPDIEKAAAKYNLPPSYIAAVMDRETNGRNILGDGGHGHGLMQIDDRSHGAWLASHHNGMDPAENIDYGASILRDNLNAAHAKGLKGDAALKFAASAYNAGLGGAERGLAAGNSDAYTTGHNYGSDVLHRMQNFSGLGMTPTQGAGGKNRPSGTGKTSKGGGSKSSGGGNYVVRSGDTLGAIASSHGVSLSALEKANPQIKNFNLIYPGEVIHLPGGSKGGSKPSGGSQKSGGSKSGGVSHSGGGKASGKDASAVAREFLGESEYQLQPSGKLDMDKWVPKNVDCANFVSGCLEKAGWLSHSQRSDNVRGVFSSLENKGWKSVALKNAKPGDVVAFDGPEGAYQHIEIFDHWQGNTPVFIGSNNVMPDGTQKITYDVGGRWAHAFHVLAPPN